MKEMRETIKVEKSGLLTASWAMGSRAMRSQTLAVALEKSDSLHKRGHVPNALLRKQFTHTK